MCAVWSEMRTLLIYILSYLILSSVATRVVR